MSIASIMGQRVIQPNTVIRAKVAATKGPSLYGESKQLLTVWLADQSKAIKCLVYDPSQFSHFGSNQSIAIRNFIKRDETIIVVTKNSRSFLTGNVSSSDEMDKTAKSMVDPEAAEVQTLEKALASPAKMVVSVQGLIVQEEQEKEVMVRNTPTKLKNIFIKDSTVEKCKVTLWRTACDNEFHPGDFIKITDVVPSSYKGETSLSLTARSTIQAAEHPTVEKTVTLYGIGRNGEVIELLTDKNEVFEAAASVVDDAFGDGDVETWIAQNAPVEVHISLKGATVEKIKLLNDS